MRSVLKMRLSNFLNAPPQIFRKLPNCTSMTPRASVIGCINRTMPSQGHTSQLRIAPCGLSLHTNQLLPADRIFRYMYNGGSQSWAMPAPNDRVQRPEQITVDKWIEHSSERLTATVLAEDVVQVSCDGWLHAVHALHDNTRSFLFQTKSRFGCLSDSWLRRAVVNTKCTPTNGLVLRPPHLPWWSPTQVLTEVNGP